MGLRRITRRIERTVKKAAPVVAAGQVVPGGDVAVTADKAVEKLTPVIPKSVAPQVESEASKQAKATLAAHEQRLTEMRRRGRRASILTAGKGVPDQLGVVNRPQARAATLLGQ